MSCYYIIDGENNRFRSLREAKHHVWAAYTQEERVKYLSDGAIMRVINEEVVTITPIIVTDKKYSFGKTKKI